MLTPSVARGGSLPALFLSILGYHAALADEPGRSTLPAEASVQPAPKTPEERVFTDDTARERLAGMSSADVRRRRIAANELETDAWKRAQSRQEWERFRDARMDALRRSLGQEIKVRADLNVGVTGAVLGKG